MSTRWQARRAARRARKAAELEAALGAERAAHARRVLASAREDDEDPSPAELQAWALDTARRRADEGPAPESPDSVAEGGLWALWGASPVPRPVTRTARPARPQRPAEPRRDRGGRHAVIDHDGAVVAWVGDPT